MLLGTGLGDTNNSAVASGTRDAHQGPRGPSPVESSTLWLSTPTGHLNVEKTNRMLFSETPFCPVPSFPASVTKATIQPDVEAPHLDRTPNPFWPRPRSPPVHRQVLWIQLQSILALLAPAPDPSNSLSSCSHAARSPALPHASRQRKLEDVSYDVTPFKSSSPQRPVFPHFPTAGSATPHLTPLQPHWAPSCSSASLFGKRPTSGLPSVHVTVPQRPPSLPHLG